MAQERISILEDPNAESKPTLNTLLRVAAAFDVGLDVRFVPFSTVLTRATSATPKQLEVPSFEEESETLEMELEANAIRSLQVVTEYWKVPDAFPEAFSPPFPDPFQSPFDTHYTMSPHTFSVKVYQNDHKLTSKFLEEDTERYTSEHTVECSKVVCITSKTNMAKVPQYKVDRSKLAV
jgi:hypothetical protein